MAASGYERTRMPAAERRAVIMRAAGPAFAARGYAGARLEDIAAVAHVTKPVIYRHFESKKALYLALLEKHEHDLPTFFDAATDRANPARLAHTILERWLDYVRENQHAWAMLFRDSSGDEEIQAVRRRVSVRARDVLAGFLAELPGSPLPRKQVEPTAELLRSGLAGLALWWIEHPRVPKSVIVEVAARMSEPVLRS